MNNKENQRVRLTKRMLKTALIDLLEDTQLQQVTITEICARAEINRTTFYKYYSTECDLYADIENDFMVILEANLANGHEKTLEELLRLIYVNRKMASVMINNSSEESLAQRIFTLPSIVNYVNFKRLDKTPYKDEINFFIFSGSYALIKRWINTDFNLSPKEVAALLNNLINKFVN